jgi:hypothetical protein
LRFQRLNVVADSCVFATCFASLASASAAFPFRFGVPVAFRPTGPSLCCAPNLSETHLGLLSVGRVDVHYVRQNCRFIFAAARARGGNATPVRCCLYLLGRRLTPAAVRHNARQDQVIVSRRTMSARVIKLCRRPLPAVRNRLCPMWPASFTSSSHIRSPAQDIFQCGVKPTLLERRLREVSLNTDTRTSHRQVPHCCVPSRGSDEGRSLLCFTARSPIFRAVRLLFVRDIVNTRRAPTFVLAVHLVGFWPLLLSLMRRPVRRGDSGPLRRALACPASFS